MQLFTSSDNESNTKFCKLPENIICFSHLRWDFVFQRPQHLLTRFSKSFHVFFIEEPIITDTAGPARYSYILKNSNLTILVPHIQMGLDAEQVQVVLKNLFDQFFENKDLSNYIFWYYTPMALNFTRKYCPELTVFDCMDELSAFKYAPDELKNLERELLQKADIVFTGGHSLYEAKKNQHKNIYALPSSIDKNHFSKARIIKSCPKDQIATQRPKLGFYGVIDERFDIALIRGIADARPDWEIILIGPIVKIDPATLPNNKNIHYLGPKTYQQLPDYIATWDIALIPFLLNESTKFISPTKTPEYLAAGLPVISTPIKDVIDPYGKNKLVRIGHNLDSFIAAAENELTSTHYKKWLLQVDNFLASNSWDLTYGNMLILLQETIKVTQGKLTSIA